MVIINWGERYWSSLQNLYSSTSAFTDHSTADLSAYQVAVSGDCRQPQRLPFNIIPIEENFV